MSINKTDSPTLHTQTIPIKQAMEARRALQSIGNSNRFSLALQWKISDLVEDVLGKVPDEYTAEYNKLIAAYQDPAAKDIPQGKVAIMDNKQQEFQDKLKELDQTARTFVFVPLLYDELDRENARYANRDISPLRNVFIITNNGNGEKEPAGKSNTKK